MSENKKTKLNIIGSLFIVFLLILSISPIKYKYQSYNSSVLGTNNGFNSFNYAEYKNDQFPPEISYKELEFTKENNNSIQLFTNEEIRMLETKQYRLEKINTNEYLLEYLGEEEKFIHKLSFIDKYANKVVINFFSNLNSFVMKEDNAINCSNKIENIYTIIFNQYNCIEEDTISSLKLKNFEYKNKNYVLNSGIEKDLVSLLNDAEKESVSILINSAFRGFDDQVEVDADYKAYLGEILSQNLVAKPGHSEHHLGTAIDFGSSEMYFTKNLKFEDTLTYNWLLTNAWKYGFVQSYPKNSLEQTGIRFEPWHWRYVGKENAKNLYFLDKITLNEYLYLINQVN